MTVEELMMSKKHRSINDSTMCELFKMFLNVDGFGICSSVSRIPRIPAFGSSDVGTPFPCFPNLLTVLHPHTPLQYPILYQGGIILSGRDRLDNN
jgi:hypothetical protein